MDNVRPIVPVLIKGDKDEIPVYALLDSGASCSAVSETIAIRVGAKFQTLNIRLGTFN